MQSGGNVANLPSRDAATLLPIIRAHVYPGTIIHSDQWNHVSSLPPVASHSAVNDSLNFVDPATGTHVQNIESYWKRAKRKIKHMKGCHATELMSSGEVWQKLKTLPSVTFARTSQSFTQCELLQLHLVCDLLGYQHIS